MSSDLSPATSLLVVEDDDDLRELMQRGLVKRGFAVRAVRTVAEAKVCLRDARYQLMLTDLGLEDDGGLALCEWAQTNAPDVTVLVATGHSDASPAARAFGAVDVLVKPLSLEQIAVSLGRALDKRSR